MQRIGSLLPGLALAGGLAFAATVLGRIGWLQANGISALTLAIVLGMLVGNTVYPRIAAASAPGVAFSKQNLLRLGVILYGLRLTFQDIGHVGLAGVAIDALVLCSTFALSWSVGTRVFGLDRTTAMLIGAGSSICGAAAVMAAEPVVRGRAEQVTVAVSTVVVFGTLAIFLYPALYHLNAQYRLITLTPAAYGLFAGSTIHEVAQVVAAGHAISDDAANTAVIAKMVRVMMLAPFLIVLSAYLSRSKNSRVAAQEPGRIVVPWFALGFVAVAGLNSLAVLPAPLVSAAIDVDTVLLAMAMAALGLTTHLSAIRNAGIKPLALAALLFAWLIGGGLAINAGVGALFASTAVTAPAAPVAAARRTFDGSIHNNSLALSPDEHTAVVSYSERAEVIVYDLVSGKVRAVLSGFVTQRNIVFAPVGNRFYVSDSSLGTVAVIDTATLKALSSVPAGAGAFGTTLSKDGSTLYVNNHAASTVTRYDLATQQPRAVITGFAQPRQGVRLSPDGKALYVTNFLGDKITVVDTATDKITGEIKGFDKLRAISVAADGKTIFAANSGSDTVAVVDVDQRAITATVAVGKDPYGAALSPDGQFVDAGNLGDDTVSVISVATQQVVSTLTGFQEPRQAIVFTRDGRFAYVLNEDLSVAKVDRASRRLVDVLAAPARPA